MDKIYTINWNIFGNKWEHFGNNKPTDLLKTPKSQWGYFLYCQS